MPSARERVAAEAERLQGRHLRELFAEDPQRFERLSVRVDDLTVDFSKEKLDAPALESLIGLSREAGLEAKREAQFAGDAVNATDGRAALHMALRDGAEAPPGDGVAGTLDRFLALAEAGVRASTALRTDRSPTWSMSASAARISGR